MSLRIDTAELIADALVIGETGLGVLGSAVPSTGANGAGLAYNDLSLPADAGKEVRTLIEAWPADGDLFVYEDTSFSFTAAPDGVYTITYRLFVDGVDLGTTTATFTVGAGNVLPPAGTLTLAGHAPTVSQPLAVAPGVGALAITGYVPSVSQPHAATPASGTVTITGHAPTVAQAAAGAIVPLPGPLSFVGHAPTVSQTGSAALVPGSGALTISGHAPAVTQSGALEATPGFIVKAVPVNYRVYARRQP